MPNLPRRRSLSIEIAANGPQFDSLIGRNNAMKTDSQLQADVMAELKWDPKVDHSHIGVAAKDGVVTLSGSVPS